MVIKGFNQSGWYKMYINKVISYRHAWDEVISKHGDDLSEIMSTLESLYNEDSEARMKSERISLKEVWNMMMYEKDWEIIDRVHYSTDGVRLSVGNIGPTRNGLSATVPYGLTDNVSRWIFQYSTIAIKYGLIKIPLLLVPMREFANGIGNLGGVSSSFARRESFEMSLGQLEIITPLSHPYPFLIIGFSNRKADDGVDVIELSSDSLKDENDAVIDRCIEFPPEYHQAGLDILNYFGTYLREQYPEEKATVKIEQKGLNVRLIVETSDGRCDVVEKALHEYELIITGEEPPEKFSNNDKLILELRNEIRIAKFRLEAQQDMIGMQNNKIDQLLNIVGLGLSQRNNVTVDFKPTITLSNSVVINQEVTAAVDKINDLLNELPESNEAYFPLKELESSLISIETESNQDSVKKSPAMRKFKRLVENVLESGSVLNTAICKAEKGWELFSDLAGRYNKLAEWCGLPVVPSFFIK